jgi:F-type H+-transporting ATPase subunit delta
MNEGLISQRYASALYDFALTNGEETRVYDEAKMLAAQFAAMPALRVALANPALSVNSKQQLILTALGGNASETLRKFVTLALTRERENKLQHIALKYIELYRERKNIYAGKITLARQLNKKTENRLMNVISANTGGALELETKIAPEIIGGFVLEADNCRWDGSIHSRLQKIRQELVND